MTTNPIFSDAFAFVAGTCRVGTVLASYEQLVAAFGPPHDQVQILIGSLPNGGCEHVSEFSLFMIVPPGQVGVSLRLARSGGI